MNSETKKFKKFDLVQSRDVDIRIGIIISEPFTANFFDDCTGSRAAEVPFDITDPKSYEHEVEMVLVYVYAPDFRGPEAVVLDRLELLEVGSCEGWIPFDQATSKLREVLSLKKFSEDLWAKEGASRSQESTSAAV